MQPASVRVRRVDTGGLDLRETLATLALDEERGLTRGAAELIHEIAGA